MYTITVAVVVTGSAKSPNHIKEAWTERAYPYRPDISADCTTYIRENKRTRLASCLLKHILEKEALYYVLLDWLFDISFWHRICIHNTILDYGSSLVPSASKIRIKTIL